MSIFEEYPNYNVTNEQKLSAIDELARTLPEGYLRDMQRLRSLENELNVKRMEIAAKYGIESVVESEMIDKYQP